MLGVDAGQVLDVAGRPQIRPVRQLDVLLYRSDGTAVGLLARLRDVLPGRYTFGITGRAPDGQLLPPGDYQVELWQEKLGKKTMPASIKAKEETKVAWTMK